MAIVRTKGKPTLFVTMTMDVNCPEVVAQLTPGQSAYDRPDILCRVYEAKKKKLLEAITVDMCFGDCDGHVAVIEFQKRGAPHCHMLIWIKDFIITPNNIDNIISAEIPPEGDPLRAIVVKTMMHGPCGRMINMNLGCVKDSKDGACMRNFPKPFNSRTILGEGSFPEYCRRSPEEGGNTAMKFVRPLGQSIPVDNRWVVPYSPYLLKRFNCHINVECCGCVTAVKYLFMYHFKGEDLVTIEQSSQGDEVGTFQARKYISACYAYWRVAEKVMIKYKPTVEQLPVHLPHEQSVLYEPTQESAENALKRKEYTKLTEYFVANVIYGESAQSLKYEDFPVKFVWKNDEGLWTPRCRESVDPAKIGRMVSIHPNSGDLFYLRLLLKYRPGAVSFENLRMIDGTLHADNKSACIALELCDDDSQWINCLNEAVAISHPKTIRGQTCN